MSYIDELFVDAQERAQGYGLLDTDACLVAIATVLFDGVQQLERIADALDMANTIGINRA